MAVGGEPWLERVAAHGRPWSTRRAAAWLTAAAAIVFGIALVAGHGDNPLIDLKVYRVGGLSWLKDLPLYTAQFPKPLKGPDLPFTYPPFAAIAFSAFGLIGYYLAAVLMVAIGFSALIWTTVLVLRARSGAANLPAATPRFVATVTIAALVLEPISSTFLHGQVNLLLMGLVATDALGPKTRLPRGVLAGIAAAIKLTPAVFLLYFVARRQWRAATTMGASFVGATLLGFLLAPRDSKAYWTKTVFDPTRIGDLGYAGNQSIRGALHRLGMSTKPEELLWLALSLAVIGLAYVGARRFLLRDDPAGALAVVAACQLLISPVSWSHHWVWVAPMMLPFAVQVVRDRSRLRTLAVSALIAVFVLGPLLFFPTDQGREMRWGWWENALGNPYTVVTLGFVLWSAVASVRTPDRRAIVQSGKRGRPAPTAWERGTDEAVRRAGGSRHGADLAAQPPGPRP
jgi:alpha-1,2-mannosyltransferase